MLVCNYIQEVQAWLNLQRLAGHSIGFVPTMGFLHEGHLELVRESKRGNDITVVSIFVNPIQFNNPEDLEKYPRDLDRDLKLLEAEACDLVFVPPVSEMYPEHEPGRQYALGGLEEVMEGQFRPGHFQGVARVVHKLFDIVRPGRSYFGLKDYQQLQVIKRMVAIADLDVEIVACETVREPDGLAMSSRNVRLGEEARAAAPGIYDCLKFARSLGRTSSPESVVAAVVKRLSQIEGFQMEYFMIADASKLHPIQAWEEAGMGVVACVAGYFGSVRLIDNMLL